MKKSLIALAALAATGAFAQSSVTLYGVVDVNLSSVKTSTWNTTAVTPATTPATATSSVSSLTQNGVSSGGQNNSRWGLRVNEDLGSGLKAVAVVESGIWADNGTIQAGPAYGRQVFGGLSSNYGTLTMGRQYTAYDDLHFAMSIQAHNAYDVSLGSVASVTEADLKTTVAAGVSPTLTSVTPVKTATATATAGAVAALVNKASAGVGTWVSYAPRFDNSVKFQSQTYYGFSGAATYGFGENKTATTAATHGAGFNVKYANGPIVAGVAYQDQALSPTFKIKNTLIAGSYDLGVAKLYANFNRASFTTPDSFGGIAAQKEYSLGASVPMGALTLVGQVAQSKGDDLGKSTGYGLEAWYDLSKRTRTYISYASAKKEMLNDERNTAFGAGVRHSF